MAEWFSHPPAETGRYRARFLSDGRDDGVYEIIRGSQGNRPCLLASWAGKWHPVEDFKREWQGPLESLNKGVMSRD